MPAKFNVETGELKSASARLSELSEEYRRISQNLIRTATETTAIYDTADNKAFVARIEGCVSTLNAMAQTLEDASVMLSKDAGIYEDTQSHNTAQANKLQSGI